MDAGREARPHPQPRTTYSFNTYGAGDSPGPASVASLTMKKKETEGESSTGEAPPTPNRQVCVGGGRNGNTFFVEEKLENLENGSGQA